MSNYGIKQLEVIRDIGRVNSEIHIGVYGCGKTYAISVALGVLCMKLNSEGVNGLNIVLLGKSQRTVKKNICNPLSDCFGINFKYDSGRKDGHTKDGKLFNQYIHIVGLNDKTSESKIRGISDIFCIVHDEAVLCSEEQFNRIMGRLRGSYSKEVTDVFKKLGIVEHFYIGSTNPDAPNHWLKQKIDSDYFDKVIEWNINDAQWEGSKTYYENLLKSYPPGSIDRQRYLECKWVAAEGVIFNNFIENKNRFIVDKVDTSKIGFATAGLDFGGNKSGTSLVFTAYYKNIKDGLIVLQSDKLLRNKGEIDPVTLNNWVIEQFNKFKQTYNIPVLELSCDSAEQYLEAGVRNALNSGRGYCVPTGDALKIKIMDRVKFVQRMFGLDMLHIHSNCKTVINSLSELCYDDKSLQDKVLDNGTTDNDTWDAFSYSFEKQISRFDFV